MTDNKIQPSRLMVYVGDVNAIALRRAFRTDSPELLTPDYFSAKPIVAARRPYLPSKAKWQGGMTCPTGAAFDTEDGADACGDCYSCRVRSLMVAASDKEAALAEHIESATVGGLLVIVYAAHWDMRDAEAGIYPQVVNVNVWDDLSEIADRVIRQDRPRTIPI